MHNSRVRIASVAALGALVALHGVNGVGRVLTENREVELLGVWEALGASYQPRVRAKHGSHKQRARQQIKAARTRAGRRAAQHRK